MEDSYMTEISQGYFGWIAPYVACRTYREDLKRVFCDPLSARMERIAGRTQEGTMTAVCLHRRPTRIQKESEPCDPSLTPEEADREKWRLADLEFGMYADAQNEQSVRRSFVIVTGVVSAGSKGAYWAFRLSDGTTRMVPKAETATVFLVRPGLPERKLQQYGGKDGKDSAESAK